MSQKCLVCSSKTERIHHPRFGDYYYCNNCEFISKDKRDIISFEKELEIYNYHNNSIDDPKYVEYFYDFLNDAIFPFVSENKSGLDFGSGPSPVLAQILERNHNYQMDIYDLFYSPNKIYIGRKYDLITTTEVVEHLDNPIEYFRLFAELLNPNGVLAIMTLFHNNNETDFLNWHYIRDESHISFYTNKTMKYIADQVGLKVIHTNNIRYTTFKLID